MLLVVGLCSCKLQSAKRLPTLHESFSKNDRNPFGAYVAYHQLTNMFIYNSIIDKKQSFDKTWNNISDTGSMYVCFSPSMYLNEDEIKAMLGYVNAGNTLFIASNYIDSNLLNEIGCSMNESSSAYFDSLRNTTASIRETPFSYYYSPFTNNFNFTDSVFTKVLGVNEQQKPNFILYFRGKGKLILHCDPKAFSNYFLLTNSN